MDQVFQSCSKKQSWAGPARPAHRPTWLKVGGNLVANNCPEYRFLPSVPANNPFVVSIRLPSRHLHTVEVRSSNLLVPTIPSTTYSLLSKSWERHTRADEIVAARGVPSGLQRTPARQQPELTDAGRVRAKSRRRVDEVHYPCAENGPSVPFRSVTVTWAFSLTGSWSWAPAVQNRARTFESPDQLRRADNLSSEWQCSTSC